MCTTSALPLATYAPESGRQGTPDLSCMAPACHCSHLHLPPPLATKGNRKGEQYEEGKDGGG